jgi:pimeloyl-ACP methyl ester carboxylesterase
MKVGSEMLRKQRQWEDWTGWAAPGTAKRPRTGAGQVRSRWETLDGRRVHLWMLLPRSSETAAWPDPATRPPLFLLHGLGCAVEAWRPTLQELARRGTDRPVYAVDMPGFGRSAGPRRAMGVPELAEWLARLMGLLGVPRAHLAGNSLGCQVGLALARRHPGRVVSLVLGGATTGGDVVSLGAMAWGLIADGVREPGVYDGSLPRQYLRAGPRRFFATVGGLRADHPVREAGAVTVPCLVVRGTRDAAVPEGAARALAAALPCGAFRAVEGSPHAVQYAAAAAFTDLLLPFCARAEAEDAFATAPAGSSR